MGLFGFGRTKIAAEELGRNTIAMMIDADKCWRDVCSFRSYKAPGPIATTEVAFARAAITLHLLGSTMPANYHERIRKAAGEYLYDCFSGQDTDVSAAWYGKRITDVIQERIIFYKQGAPSHGEMSAKLVQTLGIPGVPTEEARFVFDDAERLLRQLLPKFKPI